MPQPHEQKLHEVVNSLTSESFRSLVAARTAETSTSPSRARPAAVQKVSLKRSRRLMVPGAPIPSTGLAGGFRPGGFDDSSMEPHGFRALADTWPRDNGGRGCEAAAQTCRHLTSSCRCAARRNYTDTFALGRSARHLRLRRDQKHESTTEILGGKSMNRSFLIAPILNATL